MINSLCKEPKGHFLSAKIRSGTPGVTNIEGREYTTPDSTISAFVIRGDGYEAEVAVRGQRLEAIFDGLALLAGNEVFLRPILSEKGMLGFFSHKMTYLSYLQKLICFN